MGIDKDSVWCVQIRAKLQLLEQSFSYKGNEQEISHTAHRLSVGAFALQSALDKVSLSGAALTTLSHKELGCTQQASLGRARRESAGAGELEGAHHSFECQGLSHGAMR